jgi:type I restriction enzyme S subunit
VSRDDVAELLVPIPPLDEQRRIAAILDTADALRRNRKRAIELLDGLSQSIFLEMFGDPVVNPYSLPTQLLSTVATFISGGTPSKDVEEYWTGDIPWVSPKDMKVAEITDSEDHVSESALARTSLKAIEPSAVLIVVRGMILAHTAPIAINRRWVTINQDMKAIHFRDEIEPEFGFWCLKCQDKHILSKVGSAAHGTKRLEMADIGNLNILAPRVNRQREFVDAARESSGLLRRSIDALRNSEALLSTLQHRAFTCQL